MDEVRERCADGLPGIVCGRYSFIHVLAIRHIGRKLGKKPESVSINHLVHIGKGIVHAHSSMA